MNLIRLFGVYDVSSPKIRLGNWSDGGYVINELAIRHSDMLVSLGSNREYSFELDWIKHKPNSLVEIYDGTCGCDDFCRKYPQVTYIQRNIGITNDTIHLRDVLKNKSNVLLKVDIDLAEYIAFDDVDLSNVTCLILEVHDVKLEENKNKLTKLFTNEFSKFILFHLHGNNYGEVFKFENFEIPNVIELSFINKNLVSTYTIDNNKFPVEGVDVPNGPERMDVKLDWVNNFED